MMDKTTEHDYRAALDFLYGRINFERSANMPYSLAELKLARMTRLLELAGNPERDQKIIHIAGTKGKGSASHFVNSILTQSGFRTGRFTSPHLYRIEERFAIDGIPCSPEDLLSCIETLRPLILEMDHEASLESSHGPTYFEITTAIALLYFARSNADYTILEVGLGGRLDSTNVCQPIVSLITSISFDHTRQLGSTLESIAREKAGIIKPQRPVISGVTNPAARAVIETIAEQRESPLYQLDRDFAVNYHSPTRLDESLPVAEFYQLKNGQAQKKFDSELGTLGRHQAANAAVAVAACEQLKESRIDVAAIQRGLSSTHCPARIQITHRNPLVILDTAHNVASVDALCEVLAESQQPSPSVLLFASTQEKDVRGVLQSLVQQFRTIICTRYLSNPRGVAIEEVAKYARQCAAEQNQTVEVIEAATPDEAWSLSQRLAASDGLICVTGSFFIAAEIGERFRQSDKRLPEQNHQVIP